MRTILAAMALLLATHAPARADGFIDQVRFGGAWANPEFVDTRHVEADQVAVAGEVLFRPLEPGYTDGIEPGFLRSLLTPRPHLGLFGNLSDNGTDFVYAGLTWHYDLGSVVFLETSFGLALNNGSRNGSPNRAALGSNITFRESIGIGFNLTDRVDAIVVLEHLSHAELFDERNRGLTHLGVKVGYSF